MSNDLTTLHTHLFETLAELRAGTMPLDRAQAIRDVAQTVINAAKVEVDYIKATDGRRGTTGLIDAGRKPIEQIPRGPETRKMGGRG